MHSGVEWTAQPTSNPTYTLASVSSAMYIGWGAEVRDAIPWYTRRGELSSDTTHPDVLQWAREQHALNPRGPWNQTMC